MTEIKIEKPEISIGIKGFNAYFGEKHILKNINLDIEKNTIYSFIGQSGCGKTTLLRSINRLNDLTASFRTEGSLSVSGRNAYELKDKHQIENLRKKIGMVFQNPNPLPISVYKNLAFPIHENFNASKNIISKKITEKLKAVALYDEVHERLHKPALSLSGGQQQRLCIARSLMLEPDVLLLDEPCSALDPISTFAIEQFLLEYKKNCTIIIVTHNIEQAQRISDNIAFFYYGEILESGSTEKIFSNPESPILKQYIMRK